MLKGKVILEVPSLAIMCIRHCRYLSIHKCQGSYSVSLCQSTVHTQPKNIETLCNSLTKVVVNDEPSLTADILKTSEKFQNILGDVCNMPQVV